MADHILGPGIQKHAIRSSHVVDTMVVVIAVFVFSSSGVFSGIGGSVVAASANSSCVSGRTKVPQHHHV